MSWVIVGVKENKRSYKFVDSEEEALKIATQLTARSDEVIILEVKSKLIMKNPEADAE